MEIRYLLKTMLLPPGGLLLVLLLGFALQKWARRSSCFLIWFAVLGLWGLSCPIVAEFLATSLEIDSAIKPAKLIHGMSADAIVILSGSPNVKADEFGEPVSNDQQLVRIRYGAFLQRKTGLPILVSGGKIRPDEIRSNAETMAYDLETSFGGRARWLEMRSRTTAENAQYSYDMLSAEQKTNVLLVTEALHMKRAKWIFERVGFSVIAAPTDFTTRNRININSFVPNAKSLWLSSFALHEWLGYWVYKSIL